MAKEPCRQTSLVHRQIVTVRPDVGAVAGLEDDRRALGKPRVPHAKRDGKGCMPGKPSKLGEVYIVLAVELDGLAERSIDYRDLVLALPMLSRPGCLVLQDRPFEAGKRKSARHIRDQRFPF